MLSSWPGMLMSSGRLMIGFGVNSDASYDATGIEIVIVAAP